jgi:hypothetical protein
MSDVTTNLDSEFIEQTEDGGVWVTLGAPQAFQLPTGHIVEPDGTMTDPDGTKYRLVMRGEEFLGFQYFRADGTPAVPGEVLTLPNGQTVEQTEIDG